MDHTHILRNVTLEEIHGRVGPHWPVKIDRRHGYLTAQPDDRVRFVEAS